MLPPVYLEAGRSQFSVCFPIDIFNEHIWPAFTDCTGMLLHWIVFTSTTENVPSLLGPIQVR